MKRRAADYESQHARIPTLADYIVILAVGFGATGVAHFAADVLTPYFRETFPTRRSSACIRASSG
ncbi:MAG: hypothetical protein R3C16_09645 [Hyphomonadaceae bacterium]